MTYLCVPIFVRDISQAKRALAAAAEADADMIELRVDEFVDVGECLNGEGIETILSSTLLPCIVTCRPTWEGGHSTLDDASRMEYLRHVAQLERPIYVDVELETYR